MSKIPLISNKLTHRRYKHRRKEKFGDHEIAAPNIKKNDSPPFTTSVILFTFSGAKWVNVRNSFNFESTHPLSI